MLRIVKINADAATSAPPSMTTRRQATGFSGRACRRSGCAPANAATVSEGEPSAAASVITNAGSSSGKMGLCGAARSSNATSDSGWSDLDSSSVSVNGNDAFNSSAAQPVRRVAFHDGRRRTGLRIVGPPGRLCLIVVLDRQAVQDVVTQVPAVFAGEGRARDRSRATRTSLPGHWWGLSRASGVPPDENRAFRRKSVVSSKRSSVSHSDLRYRLRFWAGRLVRERAPPVRRAERRMRQKCRARVQRFGGAGVRGGLGRRRQTRSLDDERSGRSFIFRRISRSSSVSSRSRARICSSAYRRSR